MTKICKKLSVQYRRQARERWTVIQRLGTMDGGLNGGISKVRCDNPSAKGMVFIEKRFGKRLFEYGIPSKEIQILHQIQDHDHITKMVDHFRDKSILEGAVYMEYCDVGSMADVAQGVAKGAYVNERKIWHWFGELASALTYCHRGPQPEMNDEQIFQSGWSRIYHRDIKPGNILLTIANGQVVAKLADFGYAVTEDSLAACPNREEAIVQPGGTPGFFAPDFPFFSGASDIWQLGLSMICACIGIKSPQSKENPNGQLWNKGRPAGARYSVELSGAIKMCLEEHYERRVQAYPLLVFINSCYYPSMRGGKTCVPACRSCSPPQQNQPWLRGVENLGMENLTLKLFLHCVSSSTDSCLASNTTIRCCHVRQSCLGQPRTC
ncbi:hypothetical protein AA0113_g6449 [Alternaria arborescens]|uniref:non-specific serine/threonine protein kinase n=1 Tax=Alternaria arborescens TaxID=156630 RepID=A0A4Q4RX66_9PLEO|nr:hypothetical protein AA0113_g6449 [Alternaria arborescens]